MTRLDADELAAGAVWRCTVQPPLPYALRFTITVDEVDAPRSASASVGGDIVGTATVTVAAHPDGGTEVRLASALSPSNPFLRGIARVARPVVRFGHDWVLDAGARQFRRALD